MTGLTPRAPRLDFANCSLFWSNNREFALIWNAMSTSAPVVEPHLNQVMMRAAKTLGSEDLPLQNIILDFVRQESNHYRAHSMFNRRLYAAGYDMTRPLEERLKNELSVFLKKRSLAFNVAYCAGFENFTLFTAKFAFERADDLFVGADSAAADLWLWHLAEEYEHRSVCHDVFAAVSGNYFIRIYGLIYAFVHLNSYLDRAAAGLMAKYRDGMSEQERLASIKREKAYKWRYALYAFPRMLAILLPLYNPGRARTSAKLQMARDRYGEKKFTA